MVCGAPRSRSSGGRSAVSTTSGTRASARLDDGRREVRPTAVPDVAEQDDRSAGSCRARPSAKNPAARSSRRTRTRRPGCAPERQGEGRRPRPGTHDGLADPGRDELGREGAQDAGRRVTASSPGMPERRGDGPQLDPRLLPLPVGFRVGDDPAAREQPRPRPVDDPAPDGDHSSPSPSRAQPADRARVPAAVEALVLVEELERDVARAAADRRVGWSRSTSASRPRPSGTVPAISVTRCWTVAQGHDARAPGRSSARRRPARGGRGSRRRRSRAPRGPSPTRAARRPSRRPRRRRRRAGSCPRPRRSGTCGPRCGRGARGWRPGTSVRRAGTRRSCSRARSPRGGAGRSATSSSTGDREPDPPGEHDLVDAAATDGPGEHPDQPLATRRRRLLLARPQRREHGHGHDPAGARPERTRPSARRVQRRLEAARPVHIAVDDATRSTNAPSGRHREQEIGQDERARAERRPRVVGGGLTAGEPHPAQQHRTGAGVASAGRSTRAPASSSRQAASAS